MKSAILLALVASVMAVYEDYDPHMVADDDKPCRTFFSCKRNADQPMKDVNCPDPGQLDLP